MAQKTVVMLEDDIDGGPADETVSFSLDGTSYEIDLNSTNAAKLRDSFASWVGAARKAGRGAGPARRSTRPRRGGNDRVAEIRAWAKSNGIKVSERGRVSADVVATWEAAQKK
jgi:Lsr2